MKSTLTFLAIILSVLSVQAQTKNADVKAIEKQVDAMVNSWNKHDLPGFVYSTFTLAFTPIP